MNNIHQDATIGENVTIASFVTIEADVQIGNNCYIGPNVTIYSGARIGNNVRIFPGAVISAIPQDLKFDGEDTIVVIGDNTTIRECVTINRGTKASGKTVIGKNCLIMAYVHVAHDCIIGNNVIIANASNIAGHVEIDDFAIIGGLTAIHQFSKIGKHAILSGGSLVGKDVPPYTKAARFPLSYTGINSIGLKRRSFTEEQINLIQEIYRVLYLSNLNVSSAVTVINDKFPPSVERDEILGFIARSNRGVLKTVVLSKVEEAEYED